MPIWLRNLTYSLIQENYQDESQDTSSKAENSWVDKSYKDKVNQQTKISPPSYITKASKK